MLQQICQFVLPANDVGYCRIRLDADIKTFLPRDRERLMEHLRDAANDNRLFPLATTAGSVVVHVAGPKTAIERLCAPGSTDRLSQIVGQRVLSLGLVDRPELGTPPLVDRMAPGFQSNFAPRLQPSTAGDRVKMLGWDGTERHDRPFDFKVKFSKMSGVDDAFSKQALESLRYFFQALSVPPDDAWVNLGPGEYQRVMPETLRRTSLGATMLRCDLTLKRLTASLLHPTAECGRRFWSKVIDACGPLVPVEPHFRVWITPAKGRVGVAVSEDGNALDVTEAQLELRSEESHDNGLGRPSFLDPRSGGRPRQPTDEICWQAFKETVMPELHRELNFGMHFAEMRQVFCALVLACEFRRLWAETPLYRSRFDKKGALIAPVALSLCWPDGSRDEFSYSPTDPDCAAESAKAVDDVVSTYKAEFDQGLFYVVQRETCPQTQETLVRSFFSGAAVLGA